MNYGDLPSLGSFASTTSSFLMEEDQNLENPFNQQPQGEEAAPAPAPVAAPAPEVQSAATANTQTFDFKNWVETADDATFASNIDVFISRMPETFTKPMSETQNNHGKTGSGVKISVLDYTKQVLCGTYGSFGLRTDIPAATEEQARVCRLVIRISAFLHDIGKMGKVRNQFKTHAADSLTMVADCLTKWPTHFLVDAKTIPIVFAVIKHHRFMREFTRPDQPQGKAAKPRPLQEIYTEVLQTYNAFQEKIVTLDMLWHMMTNLSIANASTIRKVQQRRYLYEKHVINNPNKEFIQFQWLINLKQDLQQSRAAKGQLAPAVQPMAIVPPMPTMPVIPPQQFVQQYLAPPQAQYRPQVAPPVQFQAPLPIRNKYQSSTAETPAPTTTTTTTTTTTPPKNNKKDQTPTRGGGRGRGRGKKT